MPKRILVIDDVRNYPFDPDDVGYVARTAVEGFRLMEAEPGFDEIWLDFDLGSTTGLPEWSRSYDTAMPCALWLAEQAFFGVPYRVGKVVIHTANPVGREAMELLLRRFGYNVEVVEAHFGV